MTTPQLIKAGDLRLKLGWNSVPPKVDCRVVAEEYYQGMLKKIKQRDELLKALQYIEDNAPEMGGDWATMKAQAVIQTLNNK